MSAPMRVAVVGAGISGLSTHWFLEREAEHLGRAVEVETWDPRSIPGGNLATYRRDGWQHEGAAESILESRVETRELAEALGISDRIVKASATARKRYLVWGGRLRAVGPASVFGRFPTWGAKLAALKEPFVPAGPEDETVAEFARRRLGNGLFEQVVDPMVTGVYAAAPSRLSVESAFPRIKRMEMEHGSLWAALRAAHRGARRAKGKGHHRAGGSYTFQGGMSELVGALSGALRGPLHRGRPLSRLTRREDGSWQLASSEGQEDVFDHVVLAIPAYEIGCLVGLPDPLRQITSSLRYNPVSVVCLGFRREDVVHPLDGFGFLVPASEGRRVLGTLFTSSVWPHVAPPGHVLLRSMVGGGRSPELAELPDAELLRTVSEELSALLGTRGAPVFTDIQRHSRGIPEYPVGHKRAVAMLRAELEPAHLHLAGNAWDGIGVNDCIAAARPRARAIVESAPEA